MKILYSREDVSYLPKPNLVKFVLEDYLTPREITATAFVVPLLQDGSVVMANNRRRGLEFAGGHIERIETSRDAAIRECLEETGYVVTDIIPMGYLHQTSMAEVMPENYGYPFPISCQQFFVAKVREGEPYVENDECLCPVRIDPADAEEALDEHRYAIYLEARKVLRKI